MNLTEKYDMAFADANKVNREMTITEGKFDNTVTVQHNDGSYFRYNYASMVELNVHGEAFLVVHTEHNGANVFFMADVAFYQINNGEIETPNKLIYAGT